MRLSKSECYRLPQNSQENTPKTEHIFVEHLTEEQTFSYTQNKYSIYEYPFRNKIQRIRAMAAMKDFNKLSERQQHILHFMHDYMQAHGFPPTIREIGEATDINSTSVVNYNLNKLVDAAYLERSDRVSRGLRLVGIIPGKTEKKVRSFNDPQRVPMVGVIAAGQPIEVPEDIAHHIDEDDFLDIPPFLLGGVDASEVFALEVQGESMIDAMISEGDIVLLRHQQTAKNGEMVAVWLPDRGETTLKYFYREGDKVRLKPAHPTMDDIMVDARNCEVRGKVLSVIRRVH
jgi:repressor LexA